MLFRNFLKAFALMNIQDIHQTQKDFFRTHTTKDIDFRIQQLQKLKQLLKNNETILFEAIYKDFGKSAHETYITELAHVYHEINTFLKKLRRWAKPKRVTTNLVNFPARSYIVYEPLGNTLIIGAWNYPYNLTLCPVVDAIAAGNTVILKPSEIPSNVSDILTKLINNNFDKGFLHVIEGGIPETTELLDLPFDKIFFTGSTFVGKIVYQAAAKNLTPVTLELGGKSPAFVSKSANIQMTAKRLVWAKFLNAGQTCIAPDYILVEKSVETALLEAIKQEIEAHYPTDGSLSGNYCQIINQKNFDRVRGYIQEEKVYFGNVQNTEKRILSPTVMHQVTFDDPVMKDEIFGPVLPVISYEDLNSAIDQVLELSKPLSCYVYSKQQSEIQDIIKKISFGGGAINDSVMHISNPKLPFGGVGYSGIGKYHGKTGFYNFSNTKGILHKSFGLELSLKYTPYTNWKKKITKWLIE